MKLHGSLWRGAALALLFLLLTNSVGFSQSEPPVELQARPRLNCKPSRLAGRLKPLMTGAYLANLVNTVWLMGRAAFRMSLTAADHLYHAYRNAGELGNRTG